MKRNILIICLLLLCNWAAAQKVQYNVVFDITTPDTLMHQNLARWVNGIITSYPDAKVEVVFYGKSLDMITVGKSTVTDEVIKLTANKNVAFKVCEHAMKRNNVTMSQLIPGVGTVPDGIYEIIMRQHDGWGYIKATR